MYHPSPHLQPSLFTTSFPLSRITPSSYSSTTAMPRWCPCGCAAAWRRGELSRASDGPPARMEQLHPNIIPVKCFCRLAAVTPRKSLPLSRDAERSSRASRYLSGPNVPRDSRWTAPDWSSSAATCFPPPVLYCWQPSSECWGFRLWLSCLFFSFPPTVLTSASQKRKNQQVNESKERSEEETVASFSKGDLFFFILFFSWVSFR